jgi:hypothetical protein
MCLGIPQFLFCVIGRLAGLRVDVLLSPFVVQARHDDIVPQASRRLIHQCSLTADVQLLTPLELSCDVYRKYGPSFTTKREAVSRHCTCLRVGRMNGKDGLKWIRRTESLGLVKVALLF